MAIAQPPAAPVTGGNPIQLTVTSEREINRLWGIPFIGNFVRAILVIPHVVVMMALGLGLYIWFILGWIPILFLGRVPGIAVKVLTEYLHRGQRIAGYVVFLMPGGYPPLEPGAPIPLSLEINPESLEINRLWGIPVFGPVVRVILAIPHFFVLGFVGIFLGLSLVVLWIPILVLGRYPGTLARFYESFMRYGVRVSAYIFLLPVPYPPFSFSR
jgi:hypothetical protein